MYQEKDWNVVAVGILSVLGGSFLVENNVSDKYVNVSYGNSQVNDTTLYVWTYESVYSTVKLLCKK